MKIKINKSFYKKPNWKVIFKIKPFSIFGWFNISKWCKEPLWKDKFGSPRCEIVPSITIEFLWFSIYAYRGSHEYWERWLWIHKYNKGDEQKAIETWPWVDYYTKRSDWFDTEGIETRAKELATEWHNEVNQKYDNKPYTVHLESVVNVALRFIHLIPAHIRPIILAACWLHDTIEDARKTYNDVKKETNFYVAELVYALTNEKGRTRKDRANSKYYKGIRDTEFATFIKLCDRIANIEYSKESKSKMFDAYKKENYSFTRKLYDKKYNEMFVYIEQLLN